MDVLIGLGGNLGTVSEAFAAARFQLAEVGTVIASSEIFRTRAVGPPQPDYLNSAVVLACCCGIRQLHQACQRAERAAGRDRRAEVRWGPRALDLDLLLVRGAVLMSPPLEIPHPRFHERAFALVPAAEVAPDWVHPLLGKTVAGLAAAAMHIEPGAVTRIER